uniref:Uncharacterized protein n=2 Tax=Helicotheca tamesis TaxID=374047 RepID=A0A7S2I7Q5_9STRA|mmetsp:Transcript_6375/g.8616  ORF Transcript_6375/g.8616 Transcript_6375/m.8616 type:complete len:172 (+) Transcript_6375:220-735(+)
MAHFHNSAKETCNRTRKMNEKKTLLELQDENPQTGERAEVQNEEESLRGLHHWLDSKRRRRKDLALGIIIECQRRLRLSAATSTLKVEVDGDRYLARISSKVTKRARFAALTTAHDDYIAAYPENKNKLSTLAEPTKNLPNLLCHKRKNIEKINSDELRYQGRRVRVKIIS